MSTHSILIIEDDVLLCNNMKLLLQLEGYDVRIANNGKIGIAALREKRPDVILCDIMMPEMDGHSVLDAVKGEELLAEIPFIFITALGSRAEVRKGMTAGADDYLTKPFSSDELIAAVSTRIQRSESRRNHTLQLALQREQAILREATTEREREVLRLVGHGVTSKEIARQLGISMRTVNAHRTNLLDKLGAENAAMLARWAVIADRI